MLKKLTILILLLLSCAQPALAKKFREPKNKFGMAKTTLANAVFAIDSENITYTAPQALSGNILYYERIFFSSFSLGFQYGNSLERTVQASSTSSSVTVAEKASYSAYDFKAYMGNHQLGGAKFYAVASQGTLAVSSNIKTRSTSGVITEETAEASVPLSFIGLGLDIFKTYTNVGFRLEAGQVEGQTSEISSSRQADYIYTGLYYNMGIFLLF
ncbi:MAG: hypothetical protein QNL04_02295 [SAR324 cluster bacterium]|nr:hypothetical protein [SAR324 cluster bacterium]